MDNQVTVEFLKERLKKIGWNIEYHEKELATARVEKEMFTQKLAELEMIAL